MYCRKTFTLTSRGRSWY